MSDSVSLVRDAEAAPQAVLALRRGLVVDMVISGGQTGADRAGLDTGLAVGLRIDGHCPAGRVAEDGPIPDRYPMRETGSRGYGERTALNVKHSTATVILTFEDPDALTGGSAYTLRLCQSHNRPCLIVRLHPEHQPSNTRVAEALRWLARRSVVVLNVAGPRESKCPGIYVQARAFLERVLGRSTEENDGA